MGDWLAAETLLAHTTGCPTRHALRASVAYVLGENRLKRATAGSVRAHKQHQAALLQKTGVSQVAEFLADLGGCRRWVWASGQQWLGLVIVLGVGLSQ